MVYGTYYATPGKLVKFLVGHRHTMTTVSVFCLVHGSTQNAACWDLLVPELERRGHEVACMDLPTDETDASATRYAEVIAEAIPADHDDVIVVADSASGLFLPLVPERRPVKRLVFLAACIPEIGKSFIHQFKARTS